MAEDRSKALSDEALRFIVRLNSGAATRADHATFAQWRKRSPAHDAAAREAEAIWGESADLHQDDRSRTVQPGRKPSGGRGGKIVGLVLLAGLGAGAAFWATGNWTSWTADESTGVGETRTITLADGSHVTLNARSALDIDLSETGRRLTLLEGEAFFEVADNGLPFEVSAGGTVVTARGTAFDVDRHADGDVGVAVADHAVVVDPPSGRTVELEAGQQATVGADGRLGAVEAAGKDTVASWRQGLLVAENKPLAAIVEALRAYHRGWIVLRDPALAKLRVNAVLDLKSPERALKTLEKGLPIRVSTISPLVILIAPR